MIPPPLLRDQRQVDAEHLKLLSVFHYVLAGFSLLGLAFLFFHWMFLDTFFSNPELWKDAKGGPPPREVLALIQWFYLGMGAIIVAMGVGNLLAGWWLHRRRSRIASLVIAGINCFLFPFGTLLGVFTIIVLIRPSIVALYEPNPPSPVLPSA